MPRIDPLQLLKCLSVLLSPEGGILSRDEVPRLVNLMTKFSKKLVSKCVYVLILKNTETSLVDMFMAEGGWTLIQTWLQDAAQSGNWVLVKEILGLLLITPVDVERLKMNCLPKLIKNLSRREDLDGVAQLSNQIVQNWLVIVKGSAQNAASAAPSTQTQLEKRKLDSDAIGVVMQDIIGDGKPETTNELLSATEVQNEIDEDSNSIGNEQAINTKSFYKGAANESKEAGKKSTDDDSSSIDINNVEEEPKNGEIKDVKMSEKDRKGNEKDKERSTKSSTSSRTKSSSSSSRDKDRDKDRKRSSRSSSSKSKSSSSSSSRDKDKDRKDRDRERDRKDKDRSRHSSSSKSSSSKSSSKDKKESKDKSKSSDSPIDFLETKEMQAEKDKDTLQKLKPQTLDKLGRIPKKSSSTTDEKQKDNKTENKSKDNVEQDLSKKPSFSILNRKASGEERSKTVKVFNSKMRSTGLEEEVKPPPPRSAKKPNPSVQLPTIPSRRPSPPREASIMPPEKKLKIDKIDIPERPGAIKLIPPKPKPPVLQESDMFMDALTASAPKKEAKKRKRRLSVNKDAPSSPSSSPAGGDPTSPTPTSQPSSTLGLKNIAPINFYQDTLSEEIENSEEIKSDESNEDKEIVENNINSPDDNTAASPIPANDPEPALVDNEIAASPPKVMRIDGLKGVLLYAKKKGPKRSIKWKAEEELVDIRYFELDETERVNVTKTFGDMAKMDISCEREAIIQSRKPANDDNMMPILMWRMLYVCDQPDHLAPPGSKSLEKDIQFAREKSVLPAMYFDKRRIPDSAEEPIAETHQMSDPVIIPLEDPESQEIDLRNTPWPEPKGSPPQMEPQPMPPMFPNMPFNPNFNNMGTMPPGPQFVGVPPRFPGPVGPLGPMGPGPGAYGPPNMMHNNMMGPPMNQQDIMNQGPINPAMFGPGPDGYIGPGPDGYIGPVNEQNFPMPQFNGPPAPNMNMFGQNNFNHRGGSGAGDNEGRGGYRRGGGNNGGWVRMNGPRNNWKRGRGGGGRGGRLCKNIQNHGYCRNGDNCPFVH